MVLHLVLPFIQLKKHALALTSIKSSLVKASPVIGSVPLSSVY